MFNSTLLDTLGEDARNDVASAVRTINNSGILAAAKQQVETQVATAILTGVGTSPEQISKWQGIWHTIVQFATLAEQIEKAAVGTLGPQGVNPNA